MSKKTEPMHLNFTEGQALQAVNNAFQSTTTAGFALIASTAVFGLAHVAQGGNSKTAKDKLKATLFAGDASKSKMYAFINLAFKFASKERLAVVAEMQAAQGAADARDTISARLKATYGTIDAMQKAFFPSNAQETAPDYAKRIGNALAKVKAESPEALPGALRAIVCVLNVDELNTLANLVMVRVTDHLHLAETVKAKAEEDDQAMADLVMAKAKAKVKAKALIDAEASETSVEEAEAEGDQESIAA